jgi:hypothetical protein
MFSEAFLRIADPIIQDYLSFHENEDEKKLVLSHKEILGISSSLIASQIAGRRKAKHKLPLWYGTKGIIYPPSLNLEQSSSEATARFKTSITAKGKTGCDLTGGFGVDSFFLSRNFEKFYYIEPDDGLLFIAKHNHSLLGATNILYINSTAEDFIRQTREQFDLIFIDPSRRNKSQKVFKLSECIPDVTRILKSFIEKSDQILIKTSPLLDIQQGLRELNKADNINIVAVDNECKELLFQINKNTTSLKPLLAVDLDSSGHLLNSFSFSLEDEKEKVEFSTPQTWLYEPNASILKAGAFKTIATRYEVCKLHPNTHLYTSTGKVNNFPGRAFKIIQQIKLDKKTKELFPNGQANILTRNYPLSVEEIKKKTGLSEGGTLFLICTKSIHTNHIIIAEKLY